MFARAVELNKRLWMKTLWELTRGIAKIVDVLLGRMSRVEEDILSQERRLSKMEERDDPSIHSMEVKERRRVEQEQARQDTLSESDLRQELKVKYGVSGWAKKLIDSIILNRRKKDKFAH